MSSSSFPGPQVEVQVPPQSSSPPLQQQLQSNADSKVTAVSADASSDSNEADAPSPVLRRHGNNIVNKSSKARPNKGQYGWGNLPAELINRILMLSSDMLPISPMLKVHPDRLPVVEAILQRRHLVRMREVSSGWANAINSHPFWLKYLKIMRPDCDEVQLPKASASLFHMAQQCTAIVCIPCRLFNVPIAVSAANPCCATLTSFLGRLATCERHHQTFCTMCLRHQHPDNLHLVLGEAEIVNDQGQAEVTNELTCGSCRETSFMVALQYQLANCNPGSPIIFGLTAGWKEMPSYHDYCHFGNGTSMSAVNSAIDDMFLYQNTQFFSHTSDALKLQDLILKIRISLYKNRFYTPGAHELNIYDNLISNIWEDDLSGEQEAPQLRALIRHWQTAVIAGYYSDEEYQQDVHRMGTRYLEPWLREKTIELVVNRWCNQRFYYGFWVMPVDEVAQLRHSNAAVHTPLDQMALHGRNPQMGRQVPIPRDVFYQQLGRFKTPGLNEHGADSGFFFPPGELLHYFNDQFRKTLQRRLELPLTEIVERLQRRMGVREAEEHCNRLDLNHLLHMLHDKRYWMEDRIDVRATNDTMTDVTPTREHSHTPSDVGGEMILSDDHRESPRVELVRNDSPVQDQFAVKEGWDSFSEGEEAEVEEVDEYDLDNLPVEPKSSAPPSPDWKDNQTEEEDEMNGTGNGNVEPPLRPRLGSGQTSHSSSGETVNTALVTPGDSPDLITDTIQLAADEEPTLESAVGHVTSPSSSLGKRKLDEGSNPEGPPRRSPRSDSGASRDGSENVQAPAEMNQKCKQDDAAAAEKDPKHEDDKQQHQQAADASPREREQHPVRTDEHEEVERGSHDLKDDDKTASRSSTGDVTSPAPVHAPSKTTSASSEALSGVVSTVKRQPGQSAGRRAEVDQAYESYSSGYDSDSLVSEEYDDIEYGIPFVPAIGVQLGPQATEIIKQMWHSAYAPLRECLCTICLRAKNEDVTRLLLATAWAEQTLLSIE